MPGITRTYSKKLQPPNGVIFFKIAASQPGNDIKRFIHTYLPNLPLPPVPIRLAQLTPRPKGRGGGGGETRGGT